MWVQCRYTPASPAYGHHGAFIVMTGIERYASAIAVSSVFLTVYYLECAVLDSQVHVGASITGYLHHVWRALLIRPDTQLLLCSLGHVGPAAYHHYSLPRTYLTQLQPLLCAT